jgi:serine/threonine protein kinase
MSNLLTEAVGLAEHQEIGRGGSSRVKWFFDHKTGKAMAVKYVGPIVEKGGFIQEVESLSELHHPCVLKIFGWVLPEGSMYGEIHSEYAERGSLEDVMNERKSVYGREFWTWTRIAIVICDMVIGMRFVHGRGIIHRDLKPSNILVRANGRALIGDFGSSRFKDEDSTLTGDTGTVHYAAPELFEEDAVLSGKVDVFGFGLILYELFTGSAVFPICLSGLEVIRRRRSGYRPTPPEECGGFMRALIRRCWSDNPCSRPSFDEILREFESEQFKIMPGVDYEEISNIVGGVVAWEDVYCTSR